jgi:hypothetical protein
MQYRDFHLFLAERSPLSELDEWITEYRRSQRRFTFTEPEVLQSYWEQGEDVLLREDGRFQEAVLSDLPLLRQWQLSMHTLANHLLYDALLNDDWDGADLYQYLQQLDYQQAETTFHVFCLSDKRFSLSQDEEGRYHIALQREIEKVWLSEELKDLLESVAIHLLAAFPQQSRIPWATSEMIEQIKRLSSPALMQDQLTPVAVAQWLQYREEWIKVGSDIWFPQQLLPTPTQNRRYAVHPAGAEQKVSSFSLLGFSQRDEQDITEIANQEVSGDKQHKDSQPMPSGLRWKVTLRTLHLNEGYIPIPPQARTLYPRGKRLEGPCAFSGIWFVDASGMTIWLDKMRHRLYGPDVTDQLAFLDAGTILEAYWSNAGITLNLVGHDPEVFEEETRLIDLTELAQVRSTVLESYRASLRVLLAATAHGKNFAELHHELCQRQQHTPNRSTIRAILSSSSEFLFDKSEGTWKLQPNIAENIGARMLRKIALTAQQTANQDDSPSLDAISLPAMIAKNRQQLTDLRHLYQVKKSTSVIFP